MRVSKPAVPKRSSSESDRECIWLYNAPLRFVPNPVLRGYCERKTGGSERKHNAAHFPNIGSVSARDSHVYNARHNKRNNELAHSFEQL